MRDYIGKVLCGNAPFNPRRCGRAKGAAQGQENGRLVDDTICKYVNSNSVPPDRNKRQVIQRFVDQMNKMQLQPLETQVTLVDSTTGIKCRTDIIVKHKQTNRRAIVEIKATQYCLDDYMQCYSNPCRNKPIMTNGIANTERNRHILQVSAAIRSLSHARIPDVHGYILIMAKDESTCFKIESPFVRKQYWSLNIHPFPVVLPESTYKECVDIFGHQNVQYGPPSLSKLDAVMVRKDGLAHLAVAKKNVNVIARTHMASLKRLAHCLYATTNIIAVCYPLVKIHV